MSICPIVNTVKVWISAKLSGSDQWYYVGGPLEIHPDKLVFSSLRELEGPLIVNIGGVEICMDGPLKKLSQKERDDQKVYQIEFSSYYQCLTFIFSWCKVLSERELENVLETRGFTRFFGIEDLSFLLQQINCLEISDSAWKEFCKGFIEYWNLLGLELVDSLYDSRVFSHKKAQAGIPDFSLAIDEYQRFKLRVWGEVNDKTRKEINIISFFLEYLLCRQGVSNRNGDFHLGGKVEQGNDIRKFKIVGSSDQVSAFRKMIQRHKSDKGNVWISGEFGSGKTLMARAMAEEYGKNSGNADYFLISSFNQKVLVDSLTEICQQDTNKKVIVLDKMELLEESIEIKIWKLVKRYPHIKFIFVSTGKFPEIFDGETFKISNLRDRIDDIPILTEHLLKEICEQKGLAKKSIAEVFLKKFKVYKWPGNISELRNFLSHLVDYHYFDKFIDYRNEDYHHQCDPYQKQLYRFEEIKSESEFSAAYWKEKILKSVGS
jgi:hypothetical protein